MTAEQMLHKSIQVDIDLADLIGELSPTDAIDEREKQTRLRQLLTERYRGAATDFQIVFSGPQVRLTWNIPSAGVEADTENRAALVHLKRKEYRQAIERWQTALSIYSIDPDMHYNLGLTYLELRESQKGIEQLLETVRICPVYKRAYLVLGSVYSKLRQFEQAESYLKACLQLDRNNINALINLGAVMSIIRRYEDAVRCFEKAISQSPKEARAYFGLGKIYMAQGDSDNANRCFNAVVKLDPDGKLGHLARQSIQTETTESNTTSAGSDFIAGITDTQELYRIGYQSFIHGDLQAARVAYKKYLAIDGKDAEVWSTLSSCELRLGLLNEAMQSIKRAIALSPNQGSLYKQLSMIHDIRENPQEAAAAAQKAIDLGKSDSMTFFLLGRNLAAQGKSQEGLKYLQESIRQNPNNLNARYHFAELLIALGQADAGKQNLEEILWNKIDSPLKEKARQALEKLSKD